MTDTLPQFTPEYIEKTIGEVVTRAFKVKEMYERPEGERSAGWQKELAAEAAVVNGMDAHLKVIQSVEGLRAFLDRPPTPAPAGPQAAFAPGGSVDEYRTLGDRVTEHEYYKDYSARGVKGESAVMEIERRTLVDSGLTGTAAGVFLPKGQPFLASQAIDQRRLFVRDRIPSGPTNLASIPYIRELNPRTNELGATSVAEGTAKPEVTTQFVPVDAPVRKIAAWLPITEEIVQDAPTLKSYIDARLAYMLMVREEDMILNGLNNGLDVLGIRQTAGLQTQATTAGDNAKVVADSIAKIELVDGEPDTVVVNPTDYWTTVSTRHATQFDAGYGGTGLPYTGAPSGLWGLPCIRTRSMTALKVLTGAFRTAVQIFDKQGIQLRMTDSHSDYFVLNKLVILVEERFALANYRPDWFVEGTFS